MAELHPTSWLLGENTPREFSVPSHLPSGHSGAKLEKKIESLYLIRAI